MSHAETRPGAFFLRSTVRFQRITRVFDSVRRITPDLIRRMEVPTNALLGYHGKMKFPSEPVFSKKSQAISRIIDKIF
jgi:hypothetical protein